MMSNPEKTLFCRDFCPQHPTNFLQFVCNHSNCPNYLTFSCKQCQKSNVSDHDKHQCLDTNQYTKKLLSNRIDNLIKEISVKINVFSAKVNEQIKLFSQAIREWYAPMVDGTTQKQFIFTVENPSKWQKIEETANFKDELIKIHLDNVLAEFKNRLQISMADIDEQMRCLKYSATPEKWKFDKKFTHQLINVSGFGDRTMDKKSQKQVYCASLLNHPISPFNHQVSFIVNSQHVRDKLLVIGLCSKKLMVNMNFQLNLKDAIYGIYQAGKNGGSNNAFSLHCSDPSYHYKQSVGWNFKSGDMITICVDFAKKDIVIVHFMKKGKKESYEMPIRKSEGFLYPFVGMYSSGDKVSIQQPF